MIQITNLSMQYPIEKRYVEYLLNPFSIKKFTALNNVSLRINQGDRVAFLGPNGAGKTTLLKLIGGLLYPTKGTLNIHGYDIVKHNQKARKNVGFVLNEERSFYWRLTGKQNLEFFGSLNNYFGEELQNKISNLIHLVGLSKEDALKRVATYSSGMKQRLAIARGLLTDPEILILDEPTRTIDPISAEELRQIILNRIHEDKKRTLLIATHSLEEARFLCDKVCIQDKGKIVTFQSMDQINADFKTLSECYKYHMN